MKSIKEILDLGTTKEKPKTKPPPHELSATTELIKEAGLFTAKYGRSYWLGKVKRAGVSHNEMIGILKQIGAMEGKYNKGGTLTNLLTKKSNERKHGKV